MQRGGPVMKSIAVFMDAVPEGGGAYNYEASVIDILNNNGRDEYRFVYFVDSEQKRRSLARITTHEIVVYRLNFWRNLGAALTRNVFLYARFSRRGILTQTYLDRLLHRHGMDLVYCPAPSYLCRDLVFHSFVTTVWDLCHRDWPEFPEVSHGREFEAREELYRHSLAKAVAVITESDRGRRNVQAWYGVQPERLAALPFPIPPWVGKTATAQPDVQAKYGIGGKYVYYPAQFWPHKNHTYILEGLLALQKVHGIAVSAVFTGADKGNVQAVLAQARALGIADRVHYLGFVPSEDMAALYRGAVALVMPTYFGPTNIPPLEAFALDCPVCYSDLPGLRDQVGNAAFLLDLDDPSHLARQLQTILTDPALVARKVEAGHRILAQHTAGDFWRGLEGIFRKYFAIRSRWDIPA
jgi:glycosyltransferase involved in cell wall biosynthesis